MKIFPPLTIYSPPFSSAFVLVAPASLPAWGSVKPNAPNVFPDARPGKYFSRCRLFPNNKTGNVPNDVCAAIVIATEASARASSIIAVANETMSRPAPPYFSGTLIPIIPNSPIFLTNSFGKTPVLSSSLATGAISFWAKSLHIS